VWPFSRKKTIEGAPAEGGWYVGESTHQGRRMIVRKNEGESIEANKKEFGVRLGVAVPFRASDANGMPTAEELPALARIEDLLCAEVEQGGRGVHVLAITTNGMRELVFYVVESAWAEGCVARVRPQVADHELQMYTAPDPTWSLYSEFEFARA
jgi:Family of unknown function (DUF695)